MTKKIIYWLAGIVLLSLLSYLFIEVQTERFSRENNVAVTETLSRANPPYAATHPNQYELEIMSSEYRLENKLNALKHDEQLCEWADVRKEEVKTDWSHDEFKRKDYVGYTWIGENLSKDFSNSDMAFNAWKLSPLHNKNLLDPDYTDTCVRCSESYCVQLFGTK